MFTLAKAKDENLRLKFKLLLNRPQEYVPAEILEFASFAISDCFKAAIDFRQEQLKFLASEPTYTPSQESAELIERFLSINEILPVQLSLSWAYHVLLDAGLFVELEEESQPVEPEKTQFRDTESREPVSETGVRGFDDEGNEKTYTDIEVERMTAQEYQQKIMGLRRVAKIFDPSRR